MIFPGRLHIDDLKPQLSLAWVISLLCVLIYLMTALVFDSWPSKSLISSFKDKGFPETLVLMHEQTLDPIEKNNLQFRSNPNESLFLAIRDIRFWSRIESFPFYGDQLRINKNKEILKQIRAEYYASAQYQLGLGSSVTSPWSWITYQFTHANLVHLMGNVVFLFMVISFLETLIGPIWIICIYLLGGLAGGASFLMFEQGGDFSVVGASGAVCSLMAFLCVIKKNEPIPWIYFLAPVNTPSQKGYGEIYLPALIIFPVYLMTDFISVLWQSDAITSAVAHTAHIGGSLMGLLLGVSYLAIQKFLSSPLGPSVSVTSLTNPPN